MIIYVHTAPPHLIVSSQEEDFHRLSAALAPDSRQLFGAEKLRRLLQLAGQEARRFIPRTGEAKLGNTIDISFIPP